MASGGLSHAVIDEEIDRMVIEALRNKQHQALWRLPREKLRGALRRFSLGRAGRCC